ncbi:cittilin family RiPP precursor [Pendulispora brunnea]
MIRKIVLVAAVLTGHARKDRLTLPYMYY